ncbi:kinase-like domain-containing protein [Linnemannia elongata]|nr:kinase-like domain-containing protein [Linnemannia elongata]
MADMTAPIVLLSEQQQQWLDSATENHWLRRIDFQEISHLQMGVASGGFGIVHAGKWRGMPVAIKVLFSLADFIQEVQIHRAVQDFENVVKFFGVTRMRGNGDYGMVLQFAGRGSLRDYLSKHFDKLDWTKKLRLARDVASGINFIHLENICHHDLHSRNVLIDDKGKALITDFGLSRYLNKELSNNGVRGVVPYISPERLKNAPFDKSSDIYSLGVIMWELTSGYPPFDRDGENYMLAFHITTGTREKVIPGTPVEYSELYQKCWDGEPSNRPPLSFILDTLDNLLANRTNGGGGSVNDGSSLCLGDPHGPPHSLPTVTQTTGVPPEPLRKSAPIASKVPAIETTFEGQPSKPVANISPLVPKHNLSRNHPVIVTNPDAGNTVDVVDRMQGLRVEDTAERPAGPLITPARPVWMQTPGTPNGGMGTRHIHPSSPKLPITPPQQSPVKTTPRVGHPLNDPPGARHSPKNANVSPTIPEMGGGGLENMAEMGSPSVMPLGSPAMPQQRLHQFYPQQQQQHQQQQQQHGFHVNQFQHPFPQPYPPQPMYPPQQHQQQQQQHQQQYPHVYPPYPYPSSGHARQTLPDPSAYPGFGQANVPFQAYQQASIPSTTPARPVTASSSGRVTSNNSNNNWIPLDGTTRIREFFMAALRKSLDAVQWHLDHGADVMERYDNMSGRTPLHAAAMSSSLEVMTLLCGAAGPRLNLNEEDDSGQTPLHLMTHYGTNDSFPLLDYMLEMGANPNAQDSERRTPLMTALTLNDNGQLVETLLDYGADPTIMYLNNNALAEAAIRLRYECVKVLLETDLSMSEPQSLDHAIDGCYRLTDTKNQNRGLILNLLVRWRNNAEGVQRRRTLATLIAARSMQLGPRRINRQRLARQVLESTESLVHHQGRITP